MKKISFIAVLTALGQTENIVYVYSSASDVCAYCWDSDDTKYAGGWPGVSLTGRIISKK